MEEKSQTLYRILFEPPVAKALEAAGAKTLLWSLDDVLRYVPIAALYDGKEYLVERYQNVLLTPDRSRLLEAPQVTGVTGLAMGVSKVYNPADKLGPLHFVPAELDSVVRSDQAPASHGPIAGSILLDDKFTEKNMDDALSNQPRVVHIASHYVYEPGSDANSFLLLGGKDSGGQGFHLTLADLRDDPRISFKDAELVTLSGCETALGANTGDGHEVDGLGMVVIEDKHAKAAMATLWKVDDESTGLLMAEFYRRWIETPGLTKAEALRQAQLALLQGSAGRTARTSPSAGGASTAAPPGQRGAAPYANPYYWAPFVLIGNWR